MDLTWIFIIAGCLIAYFVLDWQDKAKTKKELVQKLFRLIVPGLSTNTNRSLSSECDAAAAKRRMESLRRKMELMTDCLSSAGNDEKRETLKQSFEPREMGEAKDVVEKDCGRCTERSHNLLLMLSVMDNNKYLELLPEYLDRGQVKVDTIATVVGDEVKTDKSKTKENDFAEIKGQLESLEQRMQLMYEALVNSEKRKEREFDHLEKDFVNIRGKTERDF